MGDHDKKKAAAPVASSQPPSSTLRNWGTTAVVLVFIASVFWRMPIIQKETSLEKFEKCSLAHYNTSALGLAVPIKPEEFIERRNRLARALHEEQLDAFIVEYV
jgi:hypothetical protein